MNYSSDLINELYRSFDFFNLYFVNGRLPRPVITLHRGNGKTCGSFLHSGWSKDNETLHQIEFTGDTLKNGVEDVLNTLLHEMVHLYNFVTNGNKVVDCSKQGRHNGIFKKGCTVFGLEAYNVQNKGCAGTINGPKALEAFRELSPNKAVYALFANQIVKEDKEKKESKLKPVMISTEIKEEVAAAAEKFGCDQKTLAENALRMYIWMLENNPNAIPEQFQLKQDEQSGE